MNWWIPESCQESDPRAPWNQQMTDDPPECARCSQFIGVKQWAVEHDCEHNGPLCADCAEIAGYRRCVRCRRWQELELVEQFDGEYLCYDCMSLEHWILLELRDSDGLTLHNLERALSMRPGVERLAETLVAMIHARQIQAVHGCYWLDRHEALMALREVA